MAYSQTKQTNDIEQRLSQITTQLYGKEIVAKAHDTHKAPSIVITEDYKQIQADLLKTFLLASAIIIFQVIIHVSKIVF